MKKKQITTKTDPIKELKSINKYLLAENKSFSSKLIENIKQIHIERELHSDLKNKYDELLKSHRIINENYKREKNRLDAVIKTMYNQSKPVKATHFAYETKQI